MNHDYWRPTHRQHELYGTYYDMIYVLACSHWIESIFVDLNFGQTDLSDSMPANDLPLLALFLPHPKRDKKHITMPLRFGICGKYDLDGRKSRLEMSLACRQKKSLASIASVPRRHPALFKNLHSSPPSSTQHISSPPPLSHHCLTTPLHTSPLFDAPP